jgi:hypothetical protein
MDKLVNKNIGLQNSGMSEDEAWSVMLKKAQTKLFNAYKRKDNEAIDKAEKEVDFIQRQAVRLSQR